jgi:putative ABC transport system permease protein
MPAWERRNIPNQDSGGSHFNFGDQQDYRLVNVGNVHLGDGQDGEMSPGNDRRTIATFSIIALLILAMACINFTNLATARASQRAREVALRKVLGASRRQLVVQLLSESTILAVLAMLVALALIEVGLPLLSRFLDADLAFTYFGADGIIWPVLGLVLLVGAAGGLYPAFYLSRYRPAEVLKANKSSAEPAGTGRLRSILVVAQFAVSIGLIICTSVVQRPDALRARCRSGVRRGGPHPGSAISTPTSWSASA